MSAARAKVLRADGNQAVQLPHELSFPEGQSEVLVRREGNRLILEPIDEWPEDFRACLGAWTDEIGHMDTMIAAHASCLGLVLVTNNVRHFSQVPGLPIETWT